MEKKKITSIFLITIVLFGLITLTGCIGPFAEDEPDEEIDEELAEYKEFELEISIEGNGTTNPIEGRHVYREGEEVELEAISEEDWNFKKWGEHPAYQGNKNSEITLAIHEDIKIIAHFEKEEKEEQDEEKEFDWDGKKIGEPYEAPDGLTVTLDSFDIIEKPGSFQYQIEYTLVNEKDSAIDEGIFQLYGDEELPQYGFFGELFPEDEKTRFYTFEEEKNVTFDILAYHHDQFHADSLPEDALIWEIDKIKDETEDEEEPAEYVIAGKEVTETEAEDFIDCLDEKEVTVYGAEWCPACGDLAESLGGYELVDPIWVECTEEQQKCEEEKQAGYVPEMHIEGELVDTMWPEELSEEVECNLP